MCALTLGHIFCNIPAASLSSPQVPALKNWAKVAVLGNDLTLIGSPDLRSSGGPFPVAGVAGFRDGASKFVDCEGSGCYSLNRFCLPSTF